MSDVKTFTLRCERIQADVPNMNGNIYSREVLQSMCDQAQPKIEQRRLIGRLGTSSDPIRISDASHIVTKLELDDGHLCAEIDVLGNTEGGQALLRVLAGSGIDDMEIIPYGQGSVTRVAKGTRRVEDDYRLMSLDVVPKLTPAAEEPAGRTVTIRIPVVVDEQGNCYSTGWFENGSEYPDPSYGDMVEQARECHHTSFQEKHPQTTVIRWVTVQVPIPDAETDVEGVVCAEEVIDEADG